MAEKKDFFSSKNTILEISSDERSQLFDYLVPVSTFSRITYNSVYIIDYHTQEFDYVSENPMFLCGHSAEEVKTMGYGFYFNYVIEEDVELLMQINTIGFEFFDKIPIDDRQFYTISYDFHLKNDVGNIFLINHKLTPMFLNQEGKIWKAMCIVSLSNNKEAGNIRIDKQGENRFWRYDLKGKHWNSEERIVLTEREHDILQFSIQGYTIKEVAEKMYISPATVKFHKKKMFEKLEVSNIVEAYAFATNNKLI